MPQFNNINFLISNPKYQISNDLILPNDWNTIYNNPTKIGKIIGIYSTNTWVYIIKGDNGVIAPFSENILIELNK